MKVVTPPPDLVPAEDGECHPGLLTPRQTLDLLKGQVPAHTELTQHPPVLLRLVTCKAMIITSTVLGIYIILFIGQQRNQESGVGG